MLSFGAVVKISEEACGINTQVKPCSFQERINAVSLTEKESKTGEKRSTRTVHDNGRRDRKQHFLRMISLKPALNKFGCSVAWKLPKDYSTETHVERENVVVQSQQQQVAISVRNDRFQKQVLLLVQHDESLTANARRKQYAPVDSSLFNEALLYRCRTRLALRSYTTWIRLLFGYLSDEKVHGKRNIWKRRYFWNKQDKRWLIILSLRSNTRG